MKYKGNRSGTGWLAAASLQCAAAIVVTATLAQEVRSAPRKTPGLSYRLGVVASPIPPDVRRQLKLLRPDGILVDSVMGGSAAQSAGIQPKDVLLVADGHKITRRQDLTEAVAASQGNKMTIELLRDGKRQFVDPAPTKFYGGGGVMRIGSVSGREPVRFLWNQRLNWVQLRVAQGRLLTPNWNRMSEGLTVNQAELQESLDVGASPASSCFDYEVVSPAEVVRLEMDSEGYLHCVRRPTGESTPERRKAAPAIDLMQSPGEPVVLKVGDDTGQIYRGRSLWHLWLTEPEVCRKHLTPLLQQFRKDLRPDETAAAIERELLRLDGSVRQSGPERWKELVAQLGDQRYKQREAAQTELSSGGPAAIEYLKQLPMGKLDFEQQTRVRRILRSSKEVDDESPLLIAQRLSHDPSLWWCLLERSDPSTRRTAVKQIESLTKQPAGVDPAADPASQKAARERLRTRIDAAVPKLDPKLLSPTSTSTPAPDPRYDPRHPRVRMGQHTVI